MADGALRCFASLADRFIRRGVDPAPLAQNGLTQELLQRLATAGCSAVAGAAASSPGKPLMIRCDYYECDDVSDYYYDDDDYGYYDNTVV